ncbi:stemmadenine O-acetyltransferase-like [Humulus lupulus]|uniref:stemmadenine O-acetyltransferase-like n=1 Tax=Humulus lupulus TaxID=3486 RepID=UPI002B416848|nr:stemmadenine O-acetyltransferase-like [Humulus lupulus]
MELSIASREIIKPSSQSLHLKPYNLCLFDQLIPNTFLSVILFYPMHDPKVVDLSETLTQLKKSLSETLTLYYPLSGRTKNNLCVEDFFTGVAFVEARVKCQMSEFFQGENELQNQLVPFQPFCQEKTDVPPIAFQLNVFSCGGIALGISLGHKNNDIAMLSNFLKSWTAFSTGSPEKLIKPDLSSPAILFPPKTNHFLNKYTSLMDRLWFSEGDYVTKRFVFRAKSIETLKERAKSERVPIPSRNLAISCLIWKHAMAASWVASGSHKPSIAGQAVNMRPRMKSGHHGDDSLDGALANFFWWAMASFDPNDYNVEISSSTDVELSELVVQMKESITTGFFDEHYISQLMTTSNKEGLITDVESQLELMCSLELENPDIFVFTNWKDFFKDIDFGFGKPLSVGTIGKVGPAFRNLVILVDADQWGKGSVDAFITLKAKEMALLESDENFTFYL